jgi:hypothetical protein
MTPSLPTHGSDGRCTDSVWLRLEASVRAKWPEAYGLRWVWTFGSRIVAVLCVPRCPACCCGTSYISKSVSRGRWPTRCHNTSWSRADMTANWTPTTGAFTHRTTPVDTVIDDRRGRTRSFIRSGSPTINMMGVWKVHPNIDSDRTWPQLHTPCFTNMTKSSLRLAVPKCLVPAAMVRRLAGCRSDLYPSNEVLLLGDTRAIGE